MQKTDFPLYLYGLGTVTPLNSVTIFSRVTGVVTQVPVKQGQMVNQGDLLAEIDPPNLRRKAWFRSLWACGMFLAGTGKATCLQGPAAFN